MQLKVLLPFVLSILFIQAATAQTASTLPTQEAEISENWSFYEDQDNKVYYIDFENLKVNLNDISVLDANGNVLMRDEVHGLPVNTIYELDLSRFTPGRYTIALRSYSGVINKAVEIRS